MSEEKNSESIDHVLDVLAKPLSRYILSVLAGSDPGVFKGQIEPPDDEGE